MEKDILGDTYYVCQIINNMPLEQLYDCQQLINTYVNAVSKQSDSLIEKVVHILKDNRKEEKTRAYIYLSSIIINITLELEELELLEKYVIKNTELTAGEKHFLFYQIK